MPGTEQNPVSLDPFQTIVEVGWPSLADLIVVRCGVDLPTGTGAHLPCVFRRVQPAPRTTADIDQLDSMKPVEWVGVVTGGTTFTPPNTGNKFWRNEPTEPNGIEIIPGGPVPSFPFRIPNTTEWGAPESYNPGSYLWATGWANAATSANNNCCLINVRKLLHDFEVRRERPQRNQRLSSISIAVAFNATALSSGSLTNLLVEFAAYRFVPGFEGAGDFYSTDHGMVYANSVQKIARKVCKPDAVLLRRVDFGYDLKKTITISGGQEIPTASYASFEAQPGG